MNSRTYATDRPAGAAIDVLADRLKAYVRANAAAGKNDSEIVAEVAQEMDLWFGHVADLNGVRNCDQVATGGIEYDLLDQLRSFERDADELADERRADARADYRFRCRREDRIFGVG